MQKPRFPSELSFFVFCPGPASARQERILIYCKICLLFRQDLAGLTEETDV